MSNSLKAIDDDVEDYLYLCKKYKEKPETTLTPGGQEWADPYGNHAAKLRAKERAKERKKK